MARKVYRRITQAVFDAEGKVVHQPGDVIAADAPLDTSARFEEFEAGAPDPEPEPEPAPEPPQAKRKSTTVRAASAEGAGGAHP